MSAPFVIGGGELAQAIWFDMKNQGVKSPTTLQSTIKLIGKHISSSDAQLNNVFDDAYSSGTFPGVKDPNKEPMRKVFLEAHGKIKQFLTTNVPHIVTAKQTVNLGYQAGSITIQTET